ncbi:unnamed protein product, partial [Prorocentrum cordatum]
RCRRVEGAKKASFVVPAAWNGGATRLRRTADRLRRTARRLRGGAARRRPWRAAGLRPPRPAAGRVRRPPGPRRSGGPSRSRPRRRRCWHRLRCSAGRAAAAGPAAAERQQRQREQRHWQQRQRKRGQQRQFWRVRPQEWQGRLRSSSHQRAHRSSRLGSRRHRGLLPLLPQEASGRPGRRLRERDGGQRPEEQRGRQQQLRIPAAQPLTAALLAVAPGVWGLCAGRGAHAAGQGPPRGASGPRRPPRRVPLASPRPPGLLWLPWPTHPAIP